MEPSGLTTLSGRIERRLMTDGSCTTAVPELTISRFSSSTELTGLVYDPCLCLVSQGAKEVFLAGESHRLDSAQCMLVSVDLPVEARVIEATSSRPYLGVRISLDLGIVGELLADGVPSPPPISSVRGLAMTPVEPRLLDAVTRLVELLDTPQDVDSLAPLVLREITYRLLTGPQGTRLREIVSTGAPAQRIAMAIRWLKDHLADAVQIESLAKRVKMSQSAFHTHFKHLTAMSPLQYQKRLRLQEARRIMMGEGLDAAVAAFRVGYESPSQFSREYRRMFGAPPRQDVSTIKLGAQTAN